jgi:hypothetical protein
MFWVVATSERVIPANSRASVSMFPLALVPPASSPAVILLSCCKSWIFLPQI